MSSGLTNGVIRPRQAAMLRCVQKDDQYCSWFRTETNMLFQKVLGPRNWIQWKQQVELLSDAIYFTATTLNGIQTLGEEYVRIVQIDGNQLKSPSFRRRFVMVLLETSGPLILQFLLKRATQLLEDVNVHLWPDFMNAPGVREKAVEWIPVLHESLLMTQKAHLVLFYFLGSHYQISKRLTGIQYTAIRSWMAGSGSETIYRILGFVTLSQLVITIILKYWSRKSGEDETQRLLTTASTAIVHEEDEQPVVLEAKHKCSLCLDRRRNSTATPCGHLFCWDCILDWMENKNECPICRAKFTPSRLVYLQN